MCNIGREAYNEQRRGYTLWHLQTLPIAPRDSLFLPSSSMHPPKAFHALLQTYATIADDEIFRAWQIVLRTFATGQK